MAGVPRNQLMVERIEAVPSTASSGFRWRLGRLVGPDPRRGVLEAFDRAGARVRRF